MNRKEVPKIARCARVRRLVTALQETQLVTPVLCARPLDYDFFVTENPGPWSRLSCLQPLPEPREDLS